VTTVLVFVEHDGERPLETSLQALAFGRGVAEALGVPVHTAVLGSKASSVAEALGAHGVAVAHVAGDVRLDDVVPDAWASALAQIVDGARVVLASGTERGSEVLARLGARLDQPMAANCVSVAPGDPFVVKRQRWGGSLLEEASIEGSPVLLTVAPHAVQAEEVASPAPLEIAPVEITLNDDDLRVRVRQLVARESDAVSLSEARVVVGGGRGIGGPEGFRPLEELAGLIGAAVGCSRVATSAGWRPHADQIGQTGNRIAPELYIACGISGASQHMVGARGAKRILAINSDKDAPMVTQADYAIIGDLHTVVPAISEAVRAARGG
jgi:electron transfer flavoprotein alpha subunit